MFVTKRLLVVLMVLASAGVGATMYVGLLAASSQGEAAAPTAAPNAVPVKVQVDVAGLGACVPTGVEAGGVGGSGNSGESGDFATNSGTIAGSQFNDGGFGDIGQQWWNVTVDGNVTTVNVTDNGTATVTVDAPATGPAATPSGSPSGSGSSSSPGAPVQGSSPEPAPTPTTTTPTTAPAVASTDG